MKIKVTDVDNRGDREHPYGYVYFTDSNRVLFGDTANGYGPYGIASSNWGEVSQSPYFEIAETAIREHLSPKATTPDETPDDDDDECSDCGESLEDHCEECGECDCTCDDTDDECDECGCTENESEIDCDCDNASCPAQCYSGE